MRCQGYYFKITLGTRLVQIRVQNWALKRTWKLIRTWVFIRNLSPFLRLETYSDLGVNKKYPRETWHVFKLGTELIPERSIGHS